MRTFRGSRLVFHLSVFAFVLFASVTVFAGSPPILGAVTETGWLMWNDYSYDSEPARFLGFAWDIYEEKWVSSGINDSMWYPFPPSAFFGNMHLKYSGAYHIWVGSQYFGRGFYPCRTPWTGILYGGKPHKPIDVKVAFLGGTNVRINWKPDLFGTCCYWILAKSLQTGRWVKTGREGGSTVWHQVPYESEAFKSGRLELALPSKGAYAFYIAGLSWDTKTWGDFEKDYVLAPMGEIIALPDGVSLSMRYVSKGNFEMGSPTTERSREEYEGPIHEVNIGYDFYMGDYEVTQAQWRAVMGSWAGAPDSSFGYGDDYPVYWVSWKDITGPDGFLERLNKHVSDTGQGNPTFRLPSEAEWEYACRAGTKTRFFFGDSLGGNDDNGDGPAGLLPGRRSDYMWFAGNNEPFGTKEVGTKKPNLFGLYDMSGNVWEWCQDMFHPNYIEAPSDGSAWISPVTADRVLRGGSWAPYVWHCRSARRANADPDERLPLAGFRLVWTQ